MKKTLLIAALAVGTGFSTSAHTAKHFQSDVLKPSAKNVSTEFALTGGLLNSEFKLADGGVLKFRYYFKDDLALRLGFNLTHSAESTKVFDNNNTDNGTVIENGLGVNIALGIEKHFAGTRNLSPYIGGDLMFLNFKNREDGTEIDYHTGDYRLGYSYTLDGPSAIGFGARAVIGADYYVSKHVFIGAEASFGGYYASENDYDVTIRNPNNTSVTNIKGIHSTLDFVPHVTAGVRIGFIF